MVAPFDLATDPGESVDVPTEQPERAATLRARLDAWFEPIVNDPNLFREPVLQIGWPGEGVANLWLNCAVEKSPTVGSYVFVEGLDEAGEFVRLAVDVLSPGRYRFGLHGQVPAGTRWRVSVGSASVEAEASGDGNIDLGDLELSETGRFDLRVEVIDSAEAEPTKNRLFYLSAKALNATSDSSR